MERSQNHSAARAARDEAIDLVSEREEAFIAAVDAAEAVASRGLPFTSETVRRHLHRRNPQGATLVAREPRVLGAAMRQLSREKIAVPTMEYRIEGATQNHARPQRVWKPIIKEASRG